RLSPRGRGCERCPPATPSCPRRAPGVSCALRRSGARFTRYRGRPGRPGASRQETAMELGLAGKVAIVTGASQGIGLATAQRLAAEGARVALCARGQEGLDHAAAAIREAGGEALPVAADISRLEDCNRLVGATMHAFGGVDILVNNAGTAATGAF